MALFEVVRDTARDIVRLFSTQGTAVVAGDFALSGGFGSTASVAVTAGSTDMKGEITITSAGTGQGANPTCTFTRKDGAYPATPVTVVSRGGGSQRGVIFDVADTTTTAVFTFIGTPVAAETFKLRWHTIG